MYFNFFLCLGFLPPEPESKVFIDFLDFEVASNASDDFLE